MEQRCRYPAQPSPEYRDGLPLYRCQVCADLCDQVHLDDDGICSECQPGAEEDHRWWSDFDLSPMDEEDFHG